MNDMAKADISGGARFKHYEFLYISNPDVKKILTPADSLRIAEETLLDHYNGAVSWAMIRQLDMPVPGQSPVYKAKGCVLTRLGVAGFRVLSLNRTADGYDLAGKRPTKHVMLSDCESGEFFGIVDEHWSHALRTGACAGVAAKYLMRAGSDILAITGAGYMAYASLVAMTAVMKPRRVQIWNRTANRSQEFAKRIAAEFGFEVVVADTPQACVAGADVVITTTAAPGPYLERSWFAPGVLIYTIGLNQEVDLETYREMKFIVDDRIQVQVCPDIAKLTADGIFDDSWIFADLGQVVALPDKRRESDDEQIVIRSQGLVTQDVAQAAWIYHEARRRGLGISLEAGLIEQKNASLF